MTDNTENLVLQILKGLQDGQREMRDGFQDVKHRLGRLESTVSDLRVDVVRISSTQAWHEAKLGRIDQRLDRIERELDRRDAARAATKEQQP